LPWQVLALDVERADLPASAKPQQAPPGDVAADLAEGLGRGWQGQRRRRGGRFGMRSTRSVAPALSSVVVSLMTGSLTVTATPQPGGAGLVRVEMNGRASPQTTGGSVSRPGG